MKGKIIMNTTKKAMIQETEDKFVHHVITFARQHGLTMANILESIPAILDVFMDNAEIKCDDNLVTSLKNTKTKIG
jgi:hypothetical protein